MSELEAQDEQPNAPAQEPDPEGTPGPPGPKGDKGDKGDTGEQGKQGAAGAKGEKGDSAPVENDGPIADSETRKQQSRSRTYIRGRGAVSALGADATLSFAAVNVDQGINAMRYFGRADVVQFGTTLQGVNLTLNATGLVRSWEFGKRVSSSCTNNKTVWCGMERFHVASTDLSKVYKRDSLNKASPEVLGYEDFKYAISNKSIHKATYDQGDVVAITRGTMYSYRDGTDHSWAYGESFHYADQTTYSSYSTGKTEVFSGPCILAFHENEAEIENHNGIRNSLTKSYKIVDQNSEHYKELAKKAKFKIQIADDGIHIESKEVHLLIKEDIIELNGDVKIRGDLTVTGDVTIHKFANIIENLDVGGVISSNSDVEAKGISLSGHLHTTKVGGASIMSTPPVKGN